MRLLSASRPLFHLFFLLVVPSKPFDVEKFHLTHDIIYSYVTHSGQIAIPLGYFSWYSNIRGREHLIYLLISGDTLWLIRWTGNHLADDNWLRYVGRPWAQLPLTKWLIQTSTLNWLKFIRNCYTVHSVYSFLNKIQILGIILYC